jgi:imidazolonepropionase-like amidohydrolase
MQKNKLFLSSLCSVFTNRKNARSKFIWLIAFFLYASISVAQTTDSLSYSIVMGGNIKGYSKTWKLPDGTYRNLYQYNDRGRGDSMVTDYREDEKGFLTYLSAKGVDYMKNKVEEEFSLVNNIAKWKNISENETKKLAGPAFYIGLKSAGGNMLKALMSNGNTISLIPYGSANLKVVNTINFSIPGGAKKTFSLVAIEGMGMTPSYSWMDEKNDLFANVNDWSSLIKSGYESFMPELLKTQKKQELLFFTALSQKLSVKALKGICIKNVQLFDANTGKVVPMATVFIKDNRISDVFTTANISIPSGIDIIDGRGKMLLPGLWDMHTHMSDDAEGILHIAAGVTSIRDMGNGEDLLKRMESIKAGKVIGPEEVVISGFIDGAGPYAAPTGKLINNIEEGKKYIKEFADKGYQQIKLYSSIKPEWVKPLIDEAKRYNLKVCGHIPAFMTAGQAVNAGYDEVTHMNMLILNFFGDTIDTRSTQRFLIPAQKATTIDLNSKQVKDFLQLLKDKNTVVDPTLAVFEGMFTDRDRQVPAAYKTEIDRFPLQRQRSLRAGGGGLPVPDGMDETYRQSYAAMLKIVKMLYDKGITIVPGTDGFAGFMLHRELELYVKAGIPPADVLKIATIVSARVAGREKEMGSIEKGKIANMVLIDGNPLKNISDIRKAVLVIKDGVMYDPAKLYQALSIKPHK